MSNYGRSSQVDTGHAKSIQVHNTRVKKGKHKKKYSSGFLNRPQSFDEIFWLI